MNIKHRIQTVARSAMLLVACVALCVPAHAQEVFDETTRWDDAGLAGWEGGGRKAFLTNPGGYLNIQFKAQSSPSPYLTVARRHIGLGTLVTNISFRFKALNEKPSSLRLYMRSSRSELSWYKILAMPNVGEWMDYSVPVEFSSGWTIGPCKTAKRFDMDMKHIDWLGIYVMRGGGGKTQNFALDDVRIVGILTDDADNDGMADVWELEHGLDVGNAADGQVDSDGDSMSNFAEYLAGTDPLDQASVFELKFLEKAQEEQNVDESSVTLTWSSTPNRQYSVWRSVDLMKQFGLLESGIPATPPVNQYNDTTATNDGPYFYKIKVE